VETGRKIGELAYVNTGCEEQAAVKVHGSANE
jgi:hypothetical protein